MIKYFNVFLLAIALLASSSSQVLGFGSSFSGSRVTGVVSNSNGLVMEYIPDGISKEQWKKMKEAEKNKLKGKNLGKTGITTFKSRSFMDWQKSGGKNLFPVNPKTVTDPKQLPYMQRPGGSADDSDLKGKKNAFSFSLGKKKKEETPPPPEPKKKNFWTF